jgi:hypothetical protein
VGGSYFFNNNDFRFQYLLGNLKSKKHSKLIIKFYTLKFQIVKIYRGNKHAQYDLGLVMFLYIQMYTFLYAYFTGITVRRLNNLKC